MLVVWSGWGILVVPIVLAVSVLVGAGVQFLLGAAGLERWAFVAFSLGLLAAAAANWVVGQRFNSAPPRELVDAKTGERLLFRTRHKLFWIPMQYWSIPVALAALVPLLAIKDVLSR